MAAGLQGEDRAAIVEQIELNVTSPTRQLSLALGFAPWFLGVAAYNVAIDREKALADVTEKSEVRVESGIAGVACAVEIIEKDAADPARLLAMLEIEVLIAPGFVTLGVGDAWMALTSPAHGGVKGDGVRIIRLAALIEHWRQIRAAAEPCLGRAHEPRIHMYSRHMRAPGMSDHRDTGGPEARVRVGAGNLGSEFRWKGGVNDGRVDARLLEQAPTQHRRPPAATGRTARVGSLPGFNRKPPRRTTRANARELALERLHRGDDPPLQRLEPVANTGETRVFDRSC